MLTVEVAVLVLLALGLLAGWRRDWIRDREAKSGRAGLPGHARDRS